MSLCSSFSRYLSALKLLSLGRWKGIGSVIQRSGCACCLLLLRVAWLPLCVVTWYFQHQSCLARVFKRGRGRSNTGEENTGGRHIMRTVLWETKVKTVSHKPLLGVIQLLALTSCLFGPGSVRCPRSEGLLIPVPLIYEVTGWLYVLVLSI